MSTAGATSPSRQRGRQARPRGGPGPGPGRPPPAVPPAPGGPELPDRRGPARPWPARSCWSCWSTAWSTTGPWSGAAPPAMVAATVVAALTERGARRVAVPEGILPAGLDRLEPGIELVGDDPPLTPAQLDGLDGVLTGCAVAIAETGTIVLDGGPGQGRRVLSLVPDYHLVVVTAAQVVAASPRPWPASTRPAPRPGSAAPARPATSSSTGSRASTAPGPSRSSSARDRRLAPGASAGRPRTAPSSCRGTAGR